MGTLNDFFLFCGVIVFVRFKTLLDLPFDTLKKKDLQRKKRAVTKGC